MPRIPNAINSNTGCDHPNLRRNSENSHSSARCMQSHSSMKINMVTLDATNANMVMSSRSRSLNEIMDIRVRMLSHDGNRAEISEQSVQIFQEQSLEWNCIIITVALYEDEVKWPHLLARTQISRVQGESSQRTRSWALLNQPQSVLFRRIERGVSQVKRIRVVVEEKTRNALLGSYSRRKSRAKLAASSRLRHRAPLEP